MTTTKKNTDNSNSVGQLVISSNAKVEVNAVSVYKTTISENIPLGLPNMVSGFAMAPSDVGDETQDRFRYQSAIGAILLAEGLIDNSINSIWCEHHDDFLLEKKSGRYVAIQVKTDSSENTKIRLGSEDLLESLKRFCQHESSYGDKVDEYQ
ncbi:dsDNA nuclease domain-containing protein [Methylophilus sp. 14]|uniref:dsDNA nuclease domain-containing protein n=1 Tax=Methylophilus sp. 14 TaxID=2781019 RepID=UPI00188F6067|nr:dsDNA nuclease domain-containing protein [Methylophilus sp. 14]MBF4989375.1 DUF4297 domain-containing protein [Methylophilus sp. 14]